MLIADLGNASFYLSFLLSIIYYIAAFFVDQDSKLEIKFHRLSAVLINGLLICSFFLFILCFVYSDFSVYSVFINSHTAKPLVYKVGAAWSSHEGSMLFWLFISATYSLIYSLTKKKNFISCHFHAFFQLIIHGFILITVDPFRRYGFSPPLEGNGFNPILQDYALLIHPPILYLGYAGNLISFSIIVSSLFAKFGKNKKFEEKFVKETQEEIQEIKKYILIPWAFLTLGIGLGSWWSYRELGWGGFWAWDPVENVSLLPWLAGLAFIHLSLIKNRGIILDYLLKLNGILVFIFSLFGTFVVRSGIISSIHSFASSSERGLYLLILLGIFSVIGLSSLFITTDGKKTIGGSKDEDKGGNKKEKLKTLDLMLIITSFFVTISYLVIIFTLLSPIIVNSLTNQVININEDFYKKVFSILFIPPLILLNILTFLNKSKYFFHRIVLSLLAALFFKPIFELEKAQLLVEINIFLLVNLVMQYLLYAMEQVIFKKNFNLSSIMSHLGVSIMMFGAIICSISEEKNEKLMNISTNNSIYINNYKATLEKINTIENEDFVGIEGNFSIWKGNVELGHSNPSVKFYKIEEIQLPDSSSFYHNFSDIYMLITGVDGKKNMVMVKIYYKKFVELIWIGCILVGIGGVLSFFKNKDPTYSLH